jgi:uncharacterized membrane protein
MRISIPVITIGIIVIVLGMIFHLQGKAIVGPESSFMYSNSDWITYGLQISIAGILIIIFGIILKVSKKANLSLLM